MDSVSSSTATVSPKRLVTPSRWMSASWPSAGAADAETPSSVTAIQTLLAIVSSRLGHRVIPGLPGGAGQLDQHVLDRGVLLERVHRHVLPEPGSLDPAVRHLRADR